MPRLILIRRFPTVRSRHLPELFTRGGLSGFFTSTLDMPIRPPAVNRLDKVFKVKWSRRLSAWSAEAHEQVERESAMAVVNPLMDNGAIAHMCAKLWNGGAARGSPSIPPANDAPPAAFANPSSSSSKPPRRSPASSRGHSTPPPRPKALPPRFSRGPHTGFRLPFDPPPSSRSFSALSAVRLASVTAPPGSRTHSSVAERRSLELASKIPATKEIDLKQVMDDLRDLELLDLLRGARAKAATGFKDATRALYPLFHRLDQGEIKKVTFGQLQDALPPIFTLPWTLISERLLTGKLQRLDTLSAKDKAQLLFLQIYNVGPTRAWKFADVGCRTLEDLEKRADSDKLKLTKAQKIGLKHREDIQRLIPRAEMEKLKLVLEKALQAIDPQFECEILGSYRRGVDFSSDIDLAVRHPSFVDKDDEEAAKPLMASIVRYLEKHKLVEKENQLQFGPKKYAGLIRLPKHTHYRRIDIRLAPRHSYAYMLLGSSGDALLMKVLRHVAKTKGMCLNEYGMGDKYSAEDQNPNGFQPGTMRLVESEKEIFDLLGMPFLKPEEREYRLWKDKYLKAGVKEMDYLHKL
ncbi:hypothetical protein JCM10207_009072 [Rhodosporidiobolus poonsookiae]